MKISSRTSLPERFALQHIPEPNSGCWLWTGAIYKDGYGSLWGLNQTRAHRVSWVMHFGEIPTGMMVLHKCDTPTCVNPAHLFLGDHAANMADMVAKGRHKRANHNAGKTHCNYGHELTGSNLSIRKDRGGRVCKACNCRRSNARRQA